MDDFDLGLGDGPSDFEIELKALKDRVSEVEAENSKLKEVIIDNDLEEQVEGIDCTSLEEQICVNGIRYIATLVRDQEFDDKDIKSFETLLKCLRTIRGKGDKLVKTKKQETTAELLKIVGDLDK